MIYVSRRLLITCLLLVSACVVAGIWGLRSGAVTLETSQVFAALMGDAPRSMTMVVRPSPAPARAPTAPSCSTRGCRVPLPVYWQAARLALPGR